MSAGSVPSTQADVWSVGRLLQWTREHFTAKQLDQPRLCAELLLAEALQCQKIELYTRFEHAPDAAQLTRYRELVKRAAAQEPIAYLLGRREFFSLMFAVTPDVLIPRPETETLVERALAHCKTLAAERIEILDMGSGSGCIAVSVARYQPRAHVLATDVSAAAVAVVAENAARHGVADRVIGLAADGLSIPAERVPAGGFDLILSNPPYIAESAVAGLPRNILDFEPRIALAAGDGLDFYRMLASGAPALVRPGGRCMVEIGVGQAAEVLRLFTAEARFTHAGTYRDMAGLERVMAFERCL